MLPALVLALAFVAGCLPESYHATASLPYGGEVAMSVRGMWSLQSDWHRSLLVHKSRVYVLNEGQGGCTYFTISPPAFVSGRGIFCKKISGPIQLEPPLMHVAGAEVSESQYYENLFYIDRFVPRPDTAAIADR